MLNKKGFTLIELLAVIVILGVIGVIAIPTALRSLDNAKDKNETIFKKRLSEVVDSYITNNSSTFIFNNTAFAKVQKGQNNNIYYVNLYKSTNELTLNDLVNLNLITSPIINPKNKATCNLNTKINLYRDEDFVYCYQINNMDCLTLDDKSINTCATMIPLE